MNDNNSDDVLSSKERIELKISELENGRSQILGLSANLAIAISNYDRALALSMLKLLNGQINSFENQEVTKVSATTVKDIAKGLCWRERLKLEEATGEYKAHISNMETIRAELNGLQSINKHLQ